MSDPYNNPLWRKWIRNPRHGGARALQDLAMNLWNGQVWPVNLSYVAGLSDDHWEAALAMLLDYREHGESNKTFMALCTEIAEEHEPPEVQEGPATYATGPAFERIVLCPGCGTELTAHTARGLDCGWRMSPTQTRVPPLGELLAPPGATVSDGVRLDAVSPVFLRRLAELAREDRIE